MTEEDCVWTKTSLSICVFAFHPHIIYYISCAALERIPQIHRRLLTAVTSLKTPNLTTRPIRALPRSSQLPRTGVYDNDKLQPETEVMLHVVLPVFV